MYFSWSLPLILLAGWTTALPERRTSCRQFTDTYENAAASAVGVPITTYNGITYQGWNAFTVIAATSGITPHSGTKDIGAGLRGSLTQIGDVSLVPAGNILASPSKAFDLKSFYFGCIANTQQGAASVASACTLSLTGFDTSGRQIGVATFSYAPKSLVGAPMNLATVPSRFSNLKNVTIGLSSGLVNPALTAIVVDDLTHCNYS